MTIVGDIAQATSCPAPHPGSGCWPRTWVTRWRLDRLTINYRTPAEIMAVAADVLAEIDDKLETPTSVRETGAVPWHRQVAPGDLATSAAVAASVEAAAVAGGNVAVVAPAGLVDEIRTAVGSGPILGSAADAPDVPGDGPDLDDMVVVLTVSQAKGLEFDSVLIVDPAQILADSPRGLSELYVALTRATQRLGVLHSGPAAGGAAPARTPAVTESGFGWPAAEIRRVGHQVADMVASYLAGLPDGPVYQPPPADLVAAWRRAEWPEHGTPAGALLAEFAADIARYPFGNGHPRFAAWVNSPPHPLGVLAEALAAAMNPSVAGGNHAAVHLEHQVIRWFADLLGWPAGYAGQLVSGGSAATLTALAVARHRAAARAGFDDRADGLARAGDRLVLYAGTETHSCVTKAAELLGLGSARIRVAGGRAVPDAPGGTGGPCPRRPGRRQGPRGGGGDRRDGQHRGRGPAGGDRRRLRPARDLAARGRRLRRSRAVLLLPGYAAARAGLARADSLGLDAHKWLYAPVDAGLLLVRDGAAARDTFSLVAALPAHRRR